MMFLKTVAYIITALFVAVIVALYFFQTRLIFHPGKLARNFRFKLNRNSEELFLKTSDGEEINALFYRGSRPDVILYFHGNAGDLSGWQFVAEDFTALGYNCLLIDYRGYGKSSGTISENGFYADAESAYNFLTKDKGFTPQDIIIYGRSIGTGVAIDLAGKHQTKGLVLESAYTSLRKLANEKLPMLFPSLYLRYSFNNLEKINNVKSPVLFIHGEKDELIPSLHSQKLFEKTNGKKKLVLVREGAHNDLNSFREYQEAIDQLMPTFFSPLKITP